MATYLIKRGRRWFAVLEIPKALRAELGKVRFVKATGLTSYTAAQRRVGPIIAAWQAKIAQARAKQDGGEDDDPAYWRRWLAKAKTEDEREVALSALDDKAYWIGTAGVEAGQSPYRDPDAIQFYAEATTIALLDHLEGWIKSARVTPGTSDRRRADVKRFAETFPTVQAVTRKDAQRWITGLLNNEGLAPATVRRMLSELRLFWKWLQAEGTVADSNEPFSRIEVRLGQHNGPPKREHFEPSDIVRLLRASIDRREAHLADMITLAMYTGARLNEIAALKVTSVTGDFFTISTSKTMQDAAASLSSPSWRRLFNASSSTAETAICSLD
jgi:hypothetical protein